MGDGDVIFSVLAFADTVEHTVVSIVGQSIAAANQQDKRHAMSTAMIPFYVLVVAMFLKFLLHARSRLCVVFNLDQLLSSISQEELQTRATLK